MTHFHLHHLLTLLHPLYKIILQKQLRRCWLKQPGHFKEKVCRYNTNDRRIVVASVDWGPWGEENKGNSSTAFKPRSWGALACNNDDYATAAANTMVVGRILSFLAKVVRREVEGSCVRTFCTGHSLGSHICGFAGKNYRLITKFTYIDGASLSICSKHVD